MVAEPNPNMPEFDIDSFDDEVTRSVEQASAWSGRLVLRRAGVPIALVVPTPGNADAELRQPDRSRIRTVVGEATAGFAGVPMGGREEAVAAGANEVCDAVRRERTSSGG